MNFAEMYCKTNSDYEMILLISVFICEFFVENINHVIALGNKVIKYLI